MQYPREDIFPILNVTPYPKGVEESCYTQAPMDKRRMNVITYPKGSVYPKVVNQD